MTDSHEAGSPDDLLAGLGYIKIPGERRFILSRYKEKGASSIVGLTTEGLRNLISAKFTLATSIAAKHLDAYGVGILAAELFDTTLADTMEAIGDSLFDEAIRALHEANMPGANRQRHRHSAEVLLRGAFGTYFNARDRRDGKVETRSAKIELHEKALITANLIAVIVHDAGDRASCAEWTGLAGTHFEQYRQLSTEQAENGIVLNALATGVGVAGSLAAGGALFGRPAAVVIAKNHKNRVAKHESVADRLREEEEQLAKLHGMLLS